tara:strand:+ start:142 stop:1701 length:1560 start_codon:yes stop_codon:yes gene_type:complete
MGSKVDKFMNKVSDKLVPKELAPFLPMASMLMPGLGGGIMSQYLLPQLLTAASSAKMTGEVDPMQQAITLGTSLLGSGDLKGQTAQEKAFLEQNKDLLDRSSEEALRQAKLGTGELITDSSAYYDELQKLSNSEQKQLIDRGFFNDLKDSLIPDDLFGMGFTGQDVEGSIFARDPMSFYKFDDGTMIAKDAGNFFGGDNYNLNKYLDKMATPESYSPFATTDATGTDFKKFFTEGDRALSDTAFDKRFTKAGKGLTASQKAGDTFRGIANKGTDFMQAPLGFNKSTFAKAGIAAAPFLSAKAKQMKAEQEAQEAADAEANSAYTDASSALSNYFVNRKPNYEGLYGGYYNQGGRVGLDEGGFLSNILGDSTVDNIQRGLLGIMGATDSMLGMGMSEYDDAFQEMLDSGATEEEIIDMLGPRPDFTMQANGGRVNKNMGGIMNAGSIPQTPMVPQGQQLDGRGGGFIPMGAQEKKDDVPAMLAKNEFVMTSDAVRAAGGGSIEKGAQRMYDMMNQLEAQV